MTDERELFAAEYALGTLHADERTLFSSVKTQDAEARAAAAAWERRLAPLALAVEPIAPPASVWSRLEAALSPPAAAGDAYFEDDGRNDDDASPLARLRRSRSRWRSAALTFGALAASFAAVAVFREFARAPAGEHSYVAVVNRGGELPALVVRVDVPGHAVHVRPVAAETPAGKSLELWYMPKDAPPKSLGVVPAGGMKMPMPSDMSVRDARFAVSLEPHGGSPTGEPTGPMMYKGELIEE
ncbi:anti-sigma factor domain-containing protein [Methylocella sp.]|uniref:anti-sigma factor n=1 Tax=Methylocella sp. TaxID=1978226 RepID=UPI0035B23D14